LSRTLSGGIGPRVTTVLPARQRGGLGIAGAGHPDERLSPKRSDGLNASGAVFASQGGQLVAAPRGLPAADCFVLRSISASRCGSSSAFPKKDRRVALVGWAVCSKPVSEQAEQPFFGGYGVDCSGRRTRAWHGQGTNRLCDRQVWSKGRRKTSFRHGRTSVLSAHRFDFRRKQVNKNPLGLRRWLSHPRRGLLALRVAPQGSY